MKTLNEAIEGFIGLIILGVVVLGAWGILSLFGISFGIENEGTAHYNDCRQIITLKQDDWRKYLKKFTCDYIKLPNGKILGGTCVHIENNDSLFSSGSECNIAYLYEKEPEIKCSDMVNGFIGMDGTCQCKLGYKFNNDSKKCEDPFPYEDGDGQYAWYDRHNIPMSNRCYTGMTPPCSADDWKQAMGN